MKLFGPRQKKQLAPFRLTISGISEIDSHCAAGVTHVLSLLDPDHPVPAAFTAFPPPRRLVLRFHDVIDVTPACLAPSKADVEQLLAFGRTLHGTCGAHLLIHCHAGISRSTASAALILAQAEPARSAREVFGAVVQMRPRAWPNLRILEFGDALLERNGEIVAAAAGVYQDVLDQAPFLQRAMIDRGRRREVISAWLVDSRLPPSAVGRALV